MSEGDYSESSISDFDFSEPSSTEVDEDEEKDNSYIFDSVRVSENKKTQIIEGRRVKIITAPEPGEKDERKSPMRMTLAEYTNLVGERAEQIGNGVPVNPKYAGKSVDLLKIAEMELNDRSIPFPFKIKRPIGNPTAPTRYEIFDPREPNFLMPHELLTHRIENLIPSTNYKVY